MAHIKWKPEFVEQAKKLCRLGATNQEMADFFEVGRDTIQHWLRDNEEFKQACKDGKALADAKVAEALYRRALGYKAKAVKHFVDKGEILEAHYIEHYPPDTTACIFWLKNRRPDAWRDQISSQSPTGEKTEPISITDRLKLIEASRTKK